MGNCNGWGFFRTHFFSFFLLTVFSFGFMPIEDAVYDVVVRFRLFIYRARMENLEGFIITLFCFSVNSVEVGPFFPEAFTLDI
ncbi:hypothetical protein EUGRSUZ_H00355 [Eucalyptus grandis]|uniref:Uncharacterized protein n=2 Tax=Eucalyptus grandis TaxID=71139 RepID=A0ACC3JKQ1_EUCGR|nr:hypothetical protein EUGRSUZ_H00355 [Eucalyptus grandis]